MSDHLDSIPLRVNAKRVLRPWSTSGLLRLLGAQAAAVALIAASWFQISRTASLGTQVNWIKVGILGVIVCGVANGLWLLHGRQAIGLARMQILAGAPATGVSRPTSSTSPEWGFVAIPKGSRYHAIGCAMVAGKATVVAAGDLQPFEMCVP